MDGHSTHSTAPGRSRSSQSPSPSSHSASASVSSSLHKRKLASSDDHNATFRSPYSDPRDSANEDLESISARGTGTDSEDGSEEVVDGEEEDNDSMRVFTNARLEKNVNSRNARMKLENSSVKVDPLSEVKEERLATAPAPPFPGIIVKEDAAKGIFTENMQTSGAYSAREESLKREVQVTRLDHVLLTDSRRLAQVMAPEARAWHIWHMAGHKWDRAGHMGHMARQVRMTLRTCLEARTAYKAWVTSRQA
ncbi:hypothetical protein GIB67_025584 [Kingdonia uniflora]|uniref:Uncharacterized protein n=1 Tax=Kingdonia uniflora TaxID=39325 RepID=A0A7J7M0H1_9MAGN|nr:hypothetical protein GIB67_025584 [Kingdonia uniflora]